MDNVVRLLATRASLGDHKLQSEGHEELFHRALAVTFHDLNNFMFLIKLAWGLQEFSRTLTPRSTARTAKPEREASQGA